MVLQPNENAKVCESRERGSETLLTSVSCFKEDPPNPPEMLFCRHCRGSDQCWCKKHWYLKQNSGQLKTLSDPLMTKVGGKCPF